MMPTQAGTHRHGPYHELIVGVLIVAATAAFVLAVGSLGWFLVQAALR